LTGLVLLFLAAIHEAKALRAVEITSRYIALANGSPLFVEAMEQQRQSYPKEFLQRMAHAPEKPKTPRKHG
jgi:hypothetical protein